MECVIASKLTSRWSSYTLETAINIVTPLNAEQTLFIGLRGCKENEKQTTASSHGTQKEKTKSQRHQKGQAQIVPGLLFRSCILKLPSPTRSFQVIPRLNSCLSRAPPLKL